MSADTALRWVVWIVGLVVIGAMIWRQWARDKMVIPVRHVLDESGCYFEIGNSPGTWVFRQCQLHTSAPELLLLLEEIVASFNAYDSAWEADHPRIHGEVLYDRARAAIAKAKGFEPLDAQGY